MAVPADDDIGGSAGSVQTGGQGLVAVHREAVAVAAIGETVVAEHNDEISAVGKHVGIVVADGLRRIFEAQAFSRGDNRDIGRLHRADTDHADLHQVIGRADFKDGVGFNRVIVRAIGDYGRIPSIAGSSHFGGDVGRQQRESFLGRIRRIRRLHGAVGQGCLAPVEFMVAKGDRIIADQFVVIDDRFTLVDVGQQAALHHVASIKDQHILPQPFFGGADGLNHVGDPGSTRVGTGTHFVFQLPMIVICVQERE